LIEYGLVAQWRIRSAMTVKKTVKKKGYSGEGGGLVGGGGQVWGCGEGWGGDAGE